VLSASELVRIVMEKTGARTPTELARTLRLTGYTAPRKITRWLNGDSAPDFENTIALLEAAGMLRLEGGEPVRGGDSEVLAELRALDRKLDTVVVPKLDQLAEARRQATRARS
jgi:hypothetical protein